MPNRPYWVLSKYSLPNPRRPSPNSNKFGLTILSILDVIYELIRQADRQSVVRPRAGILVTAPASFLQKPLSVSRPGGLVQ